MAQYDFDLIVIGAGSGGVRAARITAGYGARVAIAEEFRVGGTCVIRGCVPKKLYVLASRFRDEFEDAKGFGWSVGETSFDWTTLKVAKEKEITRLEGLYAQNLEKSGVRLLSMRATIESPNSVRFADGSVASTDKILVATGGAPTNLVIPGIEHAVSSNEVFDLADFPQRLLVIGSGYIAVEFASIFARLGSQVAMSYRSELPLRGFDHDLRRLLAEALAQSGVKLNAGAMPKSLKKTASGVVVLLENGAELEFDAVLAATGRRPATHGLGLEHAGVILQKGNGAVCVDAHSRSNVFSIFAVGDVTDRINLTPVAIREGHAFADTQFGGRDVKVEYDCVPSAVFTTPEIGTVGCSEEEAVRRHGEIRVFETSFRPMKATLSGRAEKVFMKLLVAADDRVVGAHILGPEAGEMAQLIAVAMKMRAKKSDFDATMALHPTMAEELVTMRSASRVAKSG
jgi:glutathione reductase (NADPH)